MKTENTPKKKPSSPVCYEGSEDVQDELRAEFREREGFVKKPSNQTPD